MRHLSWSLLAPRFLLALALVAVLCHVDNLMATLQPIAEQQLQAAPEDSIEDAPKNSDLSRYIQIRYNVPPDISSRIVNSAYAAAADTGLSPTLVLAVTAVESGMNPLSDNGADRGPMQVNPKWHAKHVAEVGGISGLFDVSLGMRTGARILKQYVVATHNDTERALQRYNGGTVPNGYATKVLREKRLLDRVAYRTTLKPRAACRMQRVSCYTGTEPINHQGQT